jgi:hypothetical protein
MVWVNANVGHIFQANFGDDRLTDDQIVRPNRDVPAREGDLGAVIGKICPYCGKSGSVIYETKERIVLECSNGHQYGQLGGEKSRV